MNDLPNKVQVIPNSPDQDIPTTPHPISIDIPDYGICVGESHHQANFVMEPMYNDYTKIYYIIEGMADCYIESQPVHLEQENLLVIPSNISHHLKDNKNKPLSLYILAIENTCLEKLPSFRQQMELLNSQATEHARPLAHHDYAAYEIPRMFRKIVNEQRTRTDGYIPTIQATVLNMIVAVNRIYDHIPAINRIDSSNPTFARIQTVADYISKNFYEPICIKNMAKMACLSVRQFTNQFKAVYGVTFTQYLHYQRVHFAQTLLAETDQPIATICFQSGFNDLAHFYRIFKKMTKSSPRQYRINSRSGISTSGSE